MRRKIRVATLMSAILATFAAPLSILATAAQADEPATPAVHPTLFASAPGGATKPDDITKLGEFLYVTYQNNAAADGTPPASVSTLVAFDQRTGAVTGTFKLLGRCDGLTADPEHNRLLASVNEDNNSSLYVITPGSPPVHYSYSPNPAETGSDGTNGGTDCRSLSHRTARSISLTPIPIAPSRRPTTPRPSTRSI